MNLLGCTIDFCSFLAAVLSNFADHRRPLQNSAACDCDESYTTFAVSVACRRWRISKKIFLKKLEYSATSENVDSSYENKYGLVHCQGLFINHRLNFMLTEVVLIPFLSNFSPND